MSRYFCWIRLPHNTEGRNCIHVGALGILQKSYIMYNKDNSENPPLMLPPQCPHVLVDFVVLPPGHGRSVTDFRGWDAHEARLRCPDDVSGDIGGCSARRALKPKFY